MSRLSLISPQCAGAIDVVVIGAGHAGLAASYLLTQHGVEHVVLERGEIANSWRNERWDSLKLLTPNWQTRLPGFSYTGDRPDDFMGMSQLVQFLQDYATYSNAPVKTQTRVMSVSKEGDTYIVDTTRGRWLAKSVIIASGACNIASIPKLSQSLPAGIVQLTPHEYRSPEQVAKGGVLVVGASATGMQLADELLKTGREVAMSVSEHVRMPRTYRGRDILYWMANCGILDQRYDEVEDIARGRRLPSSQLVGCHDKAILDLNSLRAQGATIAGRLMGVENGVAQFSGSLRNVCALADLKMKRLLSTIDAAITPSCGALDAEVFKDTDLDANPVLTMDLERRGIGTVIWATGFRPDYSWLEVPVLDHKGHLKHDGGVVDSPGLYALGLPLMRRRKSSYIFGIEDDAKDIVNHLLNYLNFNTKSNSNDFHKHNSSKTSVRRSA